MEKDTNASNVVAGGGQETAAKKRKKKAGKNTKKLLAAVPLSLASGNAPAPVGQGNSASMSSSASRSSRESEPGPQRDSWEKVESFADAETKSQTERLSANQVLNNAGGFVYQVTDEIRVRRFLILGTSGGTYYVKEAELTIENATDIIKLIEDGKSEIILKEIEAVDAGNRAPKHTPLIFCLAMVARYTSDKTKSCDPGRGGAYALFEKVCRIPTHVFQFVQFCESAGCGKTTGWGKGHRHSIAHWYLKKEPLPLAMTVTKYVQREGWSHRDLLRLSHPKTGGSAQNSSPHDDIFLYCTKGFEALLERHQEDLAITKDENGIEAKRFKQDAADYLKFLEAVELMKKCKDENEAAKLISHFQLVREHVPTSLLSSKIVWRALLKKMPLTAMIRSLGKMTAIELLPSRSEESKSICERLTNADGLTTARIHPLSVLMALSVYRSSKGDKGKLTWKPNGDIVNALDQAFYLAFKNVKPTNKRFLLALDVSGSMCSSMSGGSLSCREGSAAMAMVALKTEPKCEVVAFSDQLKVLSLNKNMQLQKVVETISNLDFSSTDCALPMLWAAQKRKAFDVFVVYTDNETYFGDMHPSEALRLYRQKSGIWDAKLIVVGMSSTKFTIADPQDPFMLDIVGFDSAAPELMRNFVMGWESDASDAMAKLRIDDE